MADIIHGLWIGGDLSQLENLCVTSFLQHGHEFHLYAYDDVGNVPDGAKICDASEVVARDQIFTSHEGSYAMFADIDCSWNFNRSA